MQRGTRSTLTLNRNHEVLEEFTHGPEVDASYRAGHRRANVNALAQTGGVIDILIINAGAIPGGGLTEVDGKKWRHARDLKVFGYINLTREICRRMRVRGAGVIIHVSGLARELRQRL